ncbi:L-threonylcarbamoyladenylate synthase [SCandidatus Aminicenantes bacterium Aminicenantia_JdfR_composite]|jgi:L-threonylcarbamoyladenylate synthase|nr:L-threonylcarbamoyladenylate synthase [SCandidatus Aminicenantes bacterium Aminicenantia_JdfR_composite]MCP2597152.1 L-threonylcarbamoyladenylate synthase [Candidatus Aminicenantes bacterium AC-335-G13]
MSNPTKIIKVNPEIIEEEKLEIIARNFREGKIIVYPTETFYGLGANPFNREAVIRIYHLKRREFGKPLPIVIHEKSQVEELAYDIPEIFYRITERFWPGPLTIVLKSKEIFPEEMIGEGGTIGMRLPDFEWLRRLIEKTGFPIIATSANISGGREISSPIELTKIFYGEVDLIVDGGNTPGKRPSTVIDLTGSRLKIIREGIISKKQLNEFLKEINYD